MRLSPASLDKLIPEVARYAYDRDAQSVGIVHFGIGAFHRAHQAWYTDAALNAGDRNWLITGISLRSRAVACQLNPQSGLYSVTERSGNGERTRIVGSVRNVMPAGSMKVPVARLLAADSTRIASFTITEKGYCRSADGSLDFALADSGSIYRLLAHGLRQRCDAGLGGLTLLSCDNLSENGRQLEQLMGQYLRRHDPDLVPWFENECACPTSMVDRIVPATTNQDRIRLTSTIGILDEAAVMTEPFSQWVIEDRFAAGRPTWDAVGAQIVADVAPYETAKLRMLNGAHSALAYLGLEHGHDYVHQAVGDREIRPLVERLMREEAASTISAAPGQDLDTYASSLLERFANPALNHRLIQIAMDGSQKIPQRWLETLAVRGAAGADSPAILTALCAWLRHVRGDVRKVDDPLAGELAGAWSTHGEVGIIDAVFGESGLVGGPWWPTQDDRVFVAKVLPAFGQVQDQLRPA
ncbi:mannitol dehydrogenase family protein [Novosphingobium album (ex Hu et al. 2023)]|uniref:Mannitol dehydrogenase family protein n=1 Tax=Novosphingobium album (ex Hu et al. 2023) TaxID=2930093 RepID=A0ABT0B5E2_9SPHN|nr:mannitol dehydrogenase family protein [Novosphingobium album (ex Hu et al. 2023)]MCJ2180265.1 mannitol dehydrogenase family protein [Novosphingobium album (ex Hu et al. 2023)]